MDALLGRPEKAGAGRSGQDPLVASFFVRAWIRDRQAPGDDRSAEALALRGKAGCQRGGCLRATRSVRRRFPLNQALKGDGPRCTAGRCGSTGVKNPTYSDTLYVTELVAPHTCEHHAGEETLTRSPTTASVTGDTSPARGEASQATFDALSAAHRSA